MTLSVKRRLSCYLPMLLAIFWSGAVASEALLRVQFLIDMKNADMSGNYRSYIDKRLDCSAELKKICEWEASQFLYVWLTNKNVEQDPKYGPNLMFDYIRKSIESGVARTLGTQLPSIYGFGKFGVPRDDELAVCWVRSTYTTPERTSIEDCIKLEIKKYGRKFPWSDEVFRSR